MKTISEELLQFIETQLKEVDDEFENRAGYSEGYKGAMADCKEFLSRYHPAPCVWTQDVHGDWNTSCGNKAFRMPTDFCSCCGHPIEAKGDEAKPKCCCIPERLCSTPKQCPSKRDGWSCTREVGHDGDHVACVIGNDEQHRQKVWPNEAAKTPATTPAKVPESCGNCIGRFDSSKCRPAYVNGVCANKDENRPAKAPDVEPWQELIAYDARTRIGIAIKQLQQRFDALQREMREGK